MKILIISVLFFLVGCLERTKLDFSWKFHLGDVSNPKEVIKPDYDDSKWRTLDIPHDFIVEGNFSEKADKSHGYLPYNIGWYRKKFDLDKEAQNRYLWIDFDGSQRDTDVYLNGNFILNHPSGYTPFRIYLDDVPSVVYGGTNVIVCKVDATQPDSWWYDGGGIYRHVWLNEVLDLHQTPWGIYVKSKVEEKSIVFGKNDGIPTGNAKVETHVEVENTYEEQKTFIIKATIYDKDHTIIDTTTSQQYTLDSKMKGTFVLNLSAEKVFLWDIVSPYLYMMKTEIQSTSNTNSTVDIRETTFGIRRIRYNSDFGFFLNGREIKIKGMANHQDFAGVGVAVSDNLEAYRVKRMKDMGANGWRTAHNPPNIELLNECDKQGLLVWDENHRNDNGTDFRADLAKLILRDRNHPSVVIWSLCNEVLCENQGTLKAERVGRSLKELILKYDDTRPVSCAMNGDWGRGLSKVVDIQGCNYKIPDLKGFHKDHPDMPMVCSESSTAYSDRGMYFTSEKQAVVSEYDVNWPSWGTSAMNAWQEVFYNDYIMGEFVWTGFDYKGEPTPYSWPNINSHFGVIDIAGFPKDRYYYYQISWKDDNEPSLWLEPHWNWDTKGQYIDVWVYSNCYAVELFVNGKSQGKKEMVLIDHLEWNVTYSPGILSAVGYDASGKQIASINRTTTGEVTQIGLEVDFGAEGIFANKQDVALIAAKALDNQGRVVPTESSMLITFTVSSGPGEIVGTGNGNPNCHEPDKSNKRTLFNGLARVIVQATDQPGDIVVKASTPGLPDASISIKTLSLPTS